MSRFCVAARRLCLARGSGGLLAFGGGFTARTAGCAGSRQLLLTKVSFPGRRDHANAIDRDIEEFLERQFPESLVALVAGVGIALCLVQDLFHTLIARPLPRRPRLISRRHNTSWEARSQK